MEKQAARAAAATRKGELELARDGARQESEQRAQELADIQEQRRNAVRNEKRRVGTIRNNRKAKRNANNAANAKAKNEMLPLPNFNNNALPAATPTAKVRSERLPAAQQALINAQRKYNNAHAVNSTASNATKQAALEARNLAQAAVNDATAGAEEHQDNLVRNTMFD
jgi:hypothetical protein